jgi:hypothetical protein
MEFIIDDEIKHQFIQRAIKSREGSVVWRCLITMRHYRPLNGRSCSSWQWIVADGKTACREEGQHWNKTS